MLLNSKTIYILTIFHCRVYIYQIVSMERGTSQIPLEPPNIHRSNILPNSSVGARLIRAARARQIQERSVGTGDFEAGRTVELLSKIGIVVGLAKMEHAFKSGMVLHGCRMFPSEVAVHIIWVDNALHWTGEVVGERLGSCMDLIIRWNRSLLRNLATTPNFPNAHGEDRSHVSPTRTMAPRLEVQGRSNTAKLNERSLWNSQASNPVDESLPFSQCTRSNIRDFPHVEGFAHVRTTRRPYSMQNRRRIVSSESNVIGIAASKVSLASMERAIIQGRCKRNCLRDISARFILDMQYNAWAPKFSI